WPSCECASKTPFPEYNAAVLLRKAVEERELARKPREAVGVNQRSDHEQQRAAENLHRVQVAAELLVELQKAADADRGDEKRNCEPCRVTRQQEHALPDSVLRRRNREHARENRPDARSPAEGKGKTEQEAADRAGLTAHVAESHVAI